MAGDAKDAERRKISRFIIFSREADWEATWKKISSLFAVPAIAKSISVPKRPSGPREARDKRNDSHGVRLFGETLRPDLGCAAFKDDGDSATVVLDMQPITSLLSIAVGRKRLVVDRIGKHQRQEFLRKLEPTAVFGRVPEQRRDWVDTMVFLFGTVSPTPLDKGKGKIGLTRARHTLYKMCILSVWRGPYG